MDTNTTTTTVELEIDGEIRQLELQVGYMGYMITTSDVRIRRMNRGGVWMKATQRVRLLVDPTTGTLGVPGLGSGEWQLVGF